MSAKHVILCGGTKLSARGGAWKSIDPINLALGDGVHDVHLRLHDLTSSMTANLSDVHTDLLEIAAFIYAADQAIRRGGKAEFEYGLKWRRHLWLEIPVRNPDFWMAPGVLNPLREVLTFLSDDDYELNFTKLKKPPPVDGYLEFRKDDADSSGIEEVMLFSGGLDSFGGAIKEIADGRRKVALVSHEPTTKVGAPQRRVVEALNKQLGGTAPVPFHIQVSLNKGKSLGKEYTQRARSFVYASLAAIVARMLGKSRIRFYENGVVSFNLPLSMQCLGGRASRTTHPQTLAGFSKLFTAIFGCDFTVENPFLWKTKTDIVRGIKASGFGKLCATTISCAHTWERTNAHTHCGTCSQCIDRRMVTLAAGLTADEDPPGMYEADLMTHSWSDPEECTLVERYVGTIREVKALGTPHAFLTRFPEVAKALRHAGKDPKSIAQAVFDLHQLHAQQILEALAGVARARADDHVLKGVPTNSLLGMALLRATSATATAPSTAVPVSVKQYDKPTADRSTFTFHFGSGSCVLGNSKEFDLIERLCAAPNVCIHTDTLMEDAWDGRVVLKNTIAKTACCLRRKLRESNVHGIEIDGSERDHYRLKTL